MQVDYQNQFIVLKFSNWTKWVFEPKSILNILKNVKIEKAPVGFELWQISSWRFNLFRYAVGQQIFYRKKMFVFFCFREKVPSKMRDYELFLVHPLPSEGDKWLTFSNSSFVEHVLDFVIWIALLHVERLFCFCVFVVFYFFFFWGGGVVFGFGFFFVFFLFVFFFFN